eukprot:TRINITY_DN16128_c0_g1_i1.p1 TRINITY_DN16128_c0_g1~~TRINITY_DN16128_c0_g1_i1.p1  ORF type:complete len:1165 (+),score=133.37 TRINITY_DN16128_c0_g1_i1:26-3520(+)
MHLANQNDDGSFKRDLISLKAASVCISLMSILLVVLATTGLAFRSQAVAVENTRDTHNLAVKKCFDTADTNLDIWLHAYIGTFANNANGKLLSFLDDIRRTAMTQHDIFIRELADSGEPVTFPTLADKILSWKSELANQRPNGLVSIGILTPNTTLLMLEQADTIGLPENQSHIDIILHGTGSLYIDNVEEFEDNGTFSGTLSGFPDLNSAMVPGLLISQQVKIGKPTWGAAYAFYQYVGADVVIPYEINGVRAGTVLARNDLRAVSNFLRVSANEAHVLLDDVELRLFAFIHKSSTVVPNTAASFKLKAHNDVGTLMGVSHGSHQWYHGAANNSEPIAPIKMEDAHDALIQQAGILVSCTDIDPAASFCNGVPRLEKIPSTPQSNLSIVTIRYEHQPDHDVNTNDEETHAPKEAPVFRSSRFYIATRDISERYGTFWRLCAVVDHDKLSENVTQTVAELQRDLVRSDNDVQDSIERDRAILLLTVVGISVVMSCVATILTNLLLKPLTNLKEQMNIVAMMKLDKIDADQPRSRLHEVAMMQTSFLSMLRRLKEFRPYIPAYVLVDDTSSEARTPSAPREEEDELEDEQPNQNDTPSPALFNPLVPERQPSVSAAGSSMPRLPAHRDPPPGENLTLVFTDIQGSTKLWGLVGNSAMVESLAIHNNVLRKILEENRGYEVKTIGDAFMVAFDCVLDACRFSIDSQLALVAAPWPTKLSKTQDYAKITSGSGQVIWNGLRVRMGVHCGLVVADNNPVTGRCDYFGPTVNTAARVEGQAVGGLVVATRAVLDALGSDGIARVGDPKILSIGFKELKGIQERVDLIGLVPANLAGRVENVRDQLATRDAFHYTIDQEQGTSAVINSKLRTTLKTADATVVYVQPAFATLFPNVMESMQAVLQTTNQIISAAESAADRTSGMIMDGAGGNITVSYNVSKSCRRHPAKAGVFVGLMNDQIKGKAHVGVATGVVAVGNVGGKKHRFSTILGHTSELSMLLATSACELGTFALGASTASGGIAKEEPFNTRPVDKWTYVGEEILIYELKAMALMPVADAWEKMLLDTDAWSSVQLQDALTRGELNPLRELVRDRPADAVLRKVLTMREKNTSLRPALVSAALQPTRSGSRSEPSDSIFPPLSRTGACISFASPLVPPSRRVSESSTQVSSGQ